MTKRVRGEEISNYILCARDWLWNQNSQLWPTYHHIQVGVGNSSEKIFQRGNSFQPMQNVRVGWKLSNLRQKILERLVKNFEQISYSFSTNKPFTWNQHLHFKMIIKLIVTFVMRDFNSFVESFLLSFFSSFSVTYLRGEIVIYE